MCEINTYYVPSSVLHDVYADLSGVNNMPALTCLLYHNIGDESDFERGLDVSTALRDFQWHIDFLGRYFNFVSLDDVISGELPSRPLLLTFDDGFRTVLQAAEVVLAPRKIPSVLFLNAGLLEGDSISLDGSLAWALNNIGLEATCEIIGIPARRTFSEVLLGDLPNFGASERARIKEGLVEVVKSRSFRCGSLLGAKELASLADLGVEIGNHTMTHVHCRALDSSELEQEIVASKTYLEQVTGLAVRSFAVPYGSEKDLTPEVLGVARSSGHQAIFLVNNRLNSLPTSGDIFYRIGVDGVPPASFPVKALFLPMLRGWKDRLTQRKWPTR